MLKKNFVFIAALILLTACGVSENSLPIVLPPNYSATQIGVTMMQTTKEYQIGDEFLIAPSIKSSWGIAHKVELGLKTFGLGLGSEIRYQFITSQNFTALAGAEADFSFPMMGYLFSRYAPINQELIDFVSNSFYFVGGKIHFGLSLESVLLGLYYKGGYLDNAYFLPDMGTSTETSFPGFVSLISFALFFREDPKTHVSLGLETGYALPMGLLYISGSYSF